jgi:hypothetical protein
MQGKPWYLPAGSGFLQITRSNIVIYDVQPLRYIEGVTLSGALVVGRFRFGCVGSCMSDFVLNGVAWPRCAVFLLYTPLLLVSNDHLNQQV